MGNKSRKSKKCARCGCQEDHKKAVDDYSKVQVTKLADGLVSLKGDLKATQQHHYPDKWVYCGGCKKSFHGKCVNVQEYEYVLMAKYRCDDCAPRLGDTIWKATVASHRREDDKVKEKDKPAQVGTKKWIEDFIPTESNVPPMTNKMMETFADGEAFMKTFDRTKKWDKPVLIKNAKGLGLSLPENFDIDRCVELVGKDTTILAVDVYKQTNFQMTMGRFAEKMKEPAADRKRLYNTLSLEFSQYELAKLVEAPQLVRDLGWADRFWSSFKSDTYSVPDSLRMLTNGNYQKEDILDHLKAKPNVEKYCLLSMGGSFTDAHTDFGGSSVWYHVYKGTKVFYGAPPTEENLKAFEEHDRAANWSECYLDTMLSGGLRRFVIKQGETLMMPSGWIHAVYTPEDSIVFGGNFLHDLNIPMQLKINEIEKRAKVDPEYVYPSFDVSNWYAAQSLIERLKDAKVNKKSILLDGAKALLPYLSAQMKLYKRRESSNAARFSPILTELTKIVEPQKKSVPAQGLSGKLKRLSSNKSSALGKKPRLTSQKQPSSSAAKQIAAADKTKTKNKTATYAGAGAKAGWSHSSTTMGGFEEESLE